MKKRYILLLVLSAFVFGFGLNAVVYSQSTPNLEKIAVVDVTRVVNESSEVLALKKEQRLKMEELQKWLATVKKEVDAQETKEAKAKLVRKYDAIFIKKQKDLQAHYASKLADIDKQISAVIAKQAREKGYTVVLAKGVVLYGGDDITGQISKLVK